MISFLIKYKKAILIITLAFFIGSIGYIGLDSYRRGSFSSNVAMVGSQPITYRDLYKASDAQARVLRNNGVDVDEEMTKYLNQQVLSALISEEVLVHFNQNGQFNKTAYEYALRHQLGVTPMEFEKQIRRSKLADRFRMALYSFYKLTPEEVRFSYQIQNGSMDGFEENKKDFEKQLFETKMETAQQAFFDDFNNRVEIKTYLNEQA